MTRLQCLVVLLFATLIVLFQASLISYLSDRGVAFTLLGASLIFLAHQLRRHSNKDSAKSA
jgi:hypothetical protein